MTSASGSSPTFAPVAVIHRLMLRSSLGPARVAMIAGLGALVLAVAFAVGASDGNSQTRVAHLVQGLGLGIVVPVVSLVFASAVLGDHRDDSTMVYLWLRPMKPSVVPLTALAAVWSIVVPACVVIVSAGALAAGGDAGGVGHAALSAGAGAVAYSALFTLASLVLGRVLIWGLAYILIWEGFVAAGAEGAARLALRSYTISILGAGRDVDLSLARHSLLVSLIVLGAVTVVCAVVSVRIYRRLDVA
ncbi:MAG: hypothetical protein R2770_04490 [Acidimicrobiales bacterium]|nr:hypothetical protein [Acidimicrobiales bacterium]